MFRFENERILGCIRALHFCQPGTQDEWRVRVESCWEIEAQIRDLGMVYWESSQWFSSRTG